MNFLGIDLKPLLNELTKFSQDQKQIVTLLKANNQLQKLILVQLGGELPPS